LWRSVEVDGWQCPYCGETIELRAVVIHPPATTGPGGVRLQGGEQPENQGVRGENGLEFEGFEDEGGMAGGGIGIG